MSKKYSEAMTVEDAPHYWLPEWWGWMEDWSQCLTCLEHNHTPCASCELPPGLLGLVCLVGGGTAALAGNMRGNVTIASQQQAIAAARVSNATAVNQQLNRQRQININVNVNQININRGNKR